MFLEAPGAEEIIDQAPLVGKAGKLFFNDILGPLGITRNDIIIGNTIRCHPPANKYPIGKLRYAAELSCRVYDNVLREYKPDIILFTYHPSAVFRQPAYLALIRADISKAFRFSMLGKRVVVLMGEKAINLLVGYPFKVGKGGLKMWRGSWHFIDGWPL